MGMARAQLAHKVGASGWFKKINLLPNTTPALRATLG